VKFSARIFARSRNRREPAFIARKNRVSSPRNSLSTNAIAGHAQFTSPPSIFAADVPTMCSMRIRTIAARGMLLSLVTTLTGFAESPPIRDVFITPTFFNPTVGQQATITFRAAVAGTARVTILDHDEPVTLCRIRWFRKQESHEASPLHRRTA
jgi:hypothetical protein